MGRGPSGLQKDILVLLARKGEGGRLPPARLRRRTIPSLRHPPASGRQIQWHVPLLCQWRTPIPRRLPVVEPVRGVRHPGPSLAILGQCEFGPLSGPSPADSQVFRPGGRVVPTDASPVQGTWGCRANQDSERHRRRKEAKEDARA